MFGGAADEQHDEQLSRVRDALVREREARVALEAVAESTRLSAERASAALASEREATQAQLQIVAVVRMMPLRIQSSAAPLAHLTHTPMLFVFTVLRLRPSTFQSSVAFTL